jgi:hypothetical protein
MAKLHATLENSKGKVVSISDNATITATVYDGNQKAYSVIIEWCNVGDFEKPTMGALVTTREWRNQPNEEYETLCKKCGGRQTDYPTIQCKYCGYHIN